MLRFPFLVHCASWKENSSPSDSGRIWILVFFSSWEGGGNFLTWTTFWMEASPVTHSKLQLRPSKTSPTWIQTEKCRGCQKWLHACGAGYGDISHLICSIWIPFPWSTGCSSWNGMEWNEQVPSWCNFKGLKEWKRLWKCPHENFVTFGNWLGTWRCWLLIGFENWTSFFPLGLLWFLLQSSRGRILVFPPPPQQCSPAPPFSYL